MVSRGAGERETGTFAEPGGRRCLVVGADAAVGRELDRQLRHRGYAVRSADAPSALELLHQRSFELLVVVPPPVGAVDALRRLRAFPRGNAALVVVVTPAGSPELLRQLLDAGAFGAFVLPLASAQVEAQLVQVERELDRLSTRAVPGDPLERFEVLFERNPYPMWFYDVETFAFLAVNDAAVDCYGYCREELLRMTLADIRPPEDVPLLRAAMERPWPHVSGTFRHRKRDGTVFPVEILSWATTFQGRPASLVLARDVTERKELEARLALSDRLVTLGSMAACVAHEINNPLTYVGGNVAYARARLEASPPGSLDARELAQALAEAERGAERVREIVADLLSLSRGADRDARPIAVQRAVEGALSMAKGQLRHRARLVTEWGEVPPVLANEGQLGQVFLNLLLNAAQAIPVGAADRHEIRISTWAEDGNVACAVADTGSGIAPEHLGRIFDPFFTTKAIGEGTGLGLSICHDIVTSLGGTISVDSAPGQGSSFVVRLPATAQRDGARPRLATPPRPAGRPRVLVVDDEELVGRALTRALGRDCDAEAETSPRRALDRLCAGERFDLVLCDLMMPQLSGVDFYERVRAAAPAAAAHVVFLTGGAFAPRERAFLETSGVTWLEKPVDLDRIRALLAGSEPRGGDGGGRPA
jgi:PAS domain S-box-containing protein